MGPAYAVGDIQCAMLLIAKLASACGSWKKLAAFGFQVDNLCPEWQYLFDEAGVTSEMLRNKGSLQFILDTVYELGPPQKLPTISSKLCNHVT